MKTKPKQKIQPKKPGPLINKMFFIGIALGDNTTNETGVVVLNRNLDLIRVDKLFTNQEIENFLATNPGTYESIICISLPINTMQLNSKWRQEAKSLHAFKLHTSAEDMLWTDRIAERGKDLYEMFQSSGISVYRYHVHLSKMRLNLLPPFKIRSQPGCKYLQTVIKDHLSVNNLPSNLLPIASLDAIVGAYTGWKMATDKEDIGYSYLDSHKDQRVVLPIKPNPRPIEKQEVKKKK
jgi:hypothetical protein